MDLIQKMVAHFKAMRERLGRRRGLVTAIASFVVFATVYACILPAVTLDAGTASEQSGVSLEQAGESSDVSATSSEQSIQSDGSDGYSVTVTYGADADLPQGATVSVTELIDSDPAYQSAKQQVVQAKKDAGEDVDESALGFKALDISILDANGNKIEPAVSVSVSLSATNVPSDADGSTMEVQHIKNDVTVETVADAGTATDGTVSLSNSTASARFDVDSFSTFTISWTANNRQRANLTVHYVDTDGNEIPGTRSSTVSVNSGSTVTLSNYADAISGYTYKRAYINTSDYYGNTTKSDITTIGFSQSSNYVRTSYTVTYYNGNDTVDYDTPSWGSTVSTIPQPSN